MHPGHIADVLLHHVAYSATLSESVDEVEFEAAPQRLAVVDVHAEVVGVFNGARGICKLWVMGSAA